MHVANKGHVKSQTSRLEEVDLFRFIIVSFALLNHCFGWFGSDLANQTDYASFRRAFSYPSVVALLFMFGNMVEIVYIKRYMSNYKSFIQSILMRASFCLLAVWAVAWLDYALGDPSLVTTIRRMALTLPTPLVSIFATYFFLLLALPLIAPLRRRGGPWALVAVIIVLEVYVVFLKPLIPTAPWPFSFLGAYFLGIGHWGPAVLPALAPVFAGMLFAGGFLVRDQSKTDRWALAAIVFGGIIILGKVAWIEGGATLAYNLTDYSNYRPNNAPEFYSWGIIFSIIVFYIARYVIHNNRFQFAKRINFMGGATFSYFFLGNIVIYLLHSLGFQALREPALTAAAFGVLAASTMLTSLWLRFGRPTMLWRTFELALTSLNAKIADRVAP